MRGLLRQLGISENERLMGMTEAAIRSMYVDTENRTSYFGMVRWILYKWFLQLRLWWGDLFTDWYYRWYLSQQKELFFSLDEGEAKTSNSESKSESESESESDSKSKSESDTKSDPTPTPEVVVNASQ